METRRRFVLEAVAELLDEVEARSRMDVLTDLAAPRPVRALAERFTALHLAMDHLEYQPSIQFRSLQALPMTWS